MAWRAWWKVMLDGTASIPQSALAVAEGPLGSRVRCPECGERLAHRNGCVECLACGYSSCG